MLHNTASYFAMAKLDCPGQIRPCTRMVRRLLHEFGRKVYWWSGFVTACLIVYLLWDTKRASSSLWSVPAPPSWASREELTLLSDSMDRWRFSMGMCEGCYAYNFNRIVSPSNSICSFKGHREVPKLLILVSTIHTHRRYRCLIRNTWGTYAKNNTGQVRLLFLFGKDPSGNLTDELLLQQEGKIFGDILQDDFNSTYRKGGELQLIMGFHWVVDHCSNINHVLKVSDDTFVNVPKALQLISSANLTNSIWGQCWNLSYPNRDMNHKWYTSLGDWPAPLYPKYCAGAYMGFTLPVIRKILLISPFISWYSGNDDVLIGMCAEKLGIPTKDVPGFYVWDRENPCNLQGIKYAWHFHGHTQEMLRYFWSKRQCFEQ